MPNYSDSHPHAHSHNCHHYCRSHCDSHHGRRYHHLHPQLQPPTPFLRSPSIIAAGLPPPRVRGPVRSLLLHGCACNSCPFNHQPAYSAHCNLLSRRSSQTPERRVVVIDGTTPSYLHGWPLNTVSQPRIRIDSSISGPLCGNRRRYERRRRSSYHYTARAAVTLAQYL